MLSELRQNIMAEELIDVEKKKEKELQTRQGNTALVLTWPADSGGKESLVFKA